MVDREHDTVVVENGERRPAYGWIIGLIILIILAILFFATNGFGLWGGSSSTGTSSGAGSSYNTSSGSSSSTNTTPQTSTSSTSAQ